MRPGGGKHKGTLFERKICKELSLWVSHGSDPDLFWRSAISGGRATVLLKGGRSIKPAGDICAVDPAGHKLTDRYFIECKHDRNLELARFLCHTGKLWKFWEVACRQAEAHKRRPMLIARQNNFPILLLTFGGALRSPHPLAELGACAVYRFADVMRTECKL